MFSTRSVATTETLSLVSPLTPSQSKSRPSSTQKIRGVALLPPPPQAPPLRGPRDTGRGEETPGEDRTSQEQLQDNSRYIYTHRLCTTIVLFWGKLWWGKNWFPFSWNFSWWNLWFPYWACHRYSIQTIHFLHICACTHTHTHTHTITHLLYHFYIGSSLSSSPATGCSCRASCHVKHRLRWRWLLYHMLWGHAGLWLQQTKLWTQISHRGKERTGNNHAVKSLGLV